MRTIYRPKTYDSYIKACMTALELSYEYGVEYFVIPITKAQRDNVDTLLGIETLNGYKVYRCWIIRSEVSIQKDLRKGIDAKSSYPRWGRSIHTMDGELEQGGQGIIGTRSWGWSRFYEGNEDKVPILWRCEID